MDARQFVTEEEAKELVGKFGALGNGAVYGIPKYAFDCPAPALDSTHKMYMLYFGNGFVCNCGLVANNIQVLGSEAAAKESLKAEMKAAGLFIPWWV